MPTFSAPELRVYPKERSERAAPVLPTLLRRRINSPFPLRLLLDDLMIYSQVQSNRRSVSEHCEQNLVVGPTGIGTCLPQIRFGTLWGGRTWPGSYFFSLNEVKGRCTSKAGLSLNPSCKRTLLFNARLSTHGVTWSRLQPRTAVQPLSCGRDLIFAICNGSSQSRLKTNTRITSVPSSSSLA